SMRSPSVRRSMRARLRSRLAGSTTLGVTSSWRLNKSSWRVSWLALVAARELTDEREPIAVGGGGELGELVSVIGDHDHGLAVVLRGVGHQLERAAAGGDLHPQRDAAQLIGRHAGDRRHVRAA